MACRNSDLAIFNDTSVSTGKVACSHQIELYAHYSDRWRTPMCGQEFKLRQGSEVIAQGCLRSLADLGLSPDEVISKSDQRKLGTCHVKELSSGAYTFELVQQGPEAKVHQLEKEIESLTKDIVKEYKTTYEPEWETWYKESALGKSGLLIQSALGGFMEGLDKWLESEQDFWDSVGDFFSDLWESIKDVLGDIADALHPSRILQTAKDIWEGACSTAEAISDYVAELPEKIADVYAGTLRIIKNIGEITRFIKDFTTGNWKGIEAFIDNTLSNLCEDKETAEKWAQTMRNNAEGWAMVLELVGGTRAPALLVGAITSIGAAIPPQVWASVGIASVVIISIELIIAKILILFTTVVGAVSAGAGAVVGGVLLVGRAAKLAKIGGRAWKFVKSLMDKLQAIIDKMVELGEAAVKARQRLTKQGGIARGSAASIIKQERTRKQRQPECGICGNKLEKPHPTKEPNYNGIISRSGSGKRGTAYGRTGSYSDSSVGDNMKAAQPDSHPVHQGVTMTHHHILMISKVENNATGKKLRKLGYVIHDPGNLVLMPNHKYGACHLEVQAHLARHTTTTTPEGANRGYGAAIDRVLTEANKKIKSGEWCRDNKVDEVQKFMNGKSEEILNEIAAFNIQVQSNNYRFKPGELGCGDCSDRNHGPGALLPRLRINGAQQSTANTREEISYQKQGAWNFQPGQ